MKTQISPLRSGNKRQILNPNTDYTVLPQATSHIGHGGTNTKVIASVCEKVVAENPESLKIMINGKTFILPAHRSVSGKTVTYQCNISNDDCASLGATPSIRQSVLSIQGGIPMIYNGRNELITICPSLVTIL